VGRESGGGRQSCCPATPDCVLIPTDPKLVHILTRLAERRGLDGLPPLLLEGRMGTGKRHHLHHLIRQLCCSEGYQPFGGPAEQACSCASCRRLEARDCEDCCELSGREPISQLRDRVADLTAHQPTMIPKRVLLLRRLDSYSPLALDTLLRLAETPPPHVRILATARSAAALPETVSGRFRVLRLPPLSLEQVRSVAATSPSLRSLLADAGTYPYSSIGQMSACVRFGFERRFQQDVLGADFAGMEPRVMGMLRAIEQSEEHRTADVIEFLIEWLYWRVGDHCQQRVGEHAGYGTMLNHLPGLTRMYQTTLARYLHTANPRASITPSAHVYGYISALAMLRRSAIPAKGEGA
jgi:hypothetical protein